MAKRLLLGLCVCFVFFAGCETIDSRIGDTVLGLLGGGEPLSLETIAAGLKEALAVGTKNASGQLSIEGGYAANPKVRIPMPEELDLLARTLRRVGLGAQVAAFEGKMNQAAEQAAGKAVPVFMDAIRQMSIADAKQILSGGESAATNYFKSKTGAKLQEMYRPIATKYMEKVGVVSSYNQLLARYEKIPFLPRPKFSMEDYISKKGVDGLFTVLAEEEGKIRSNPAARTTELLRKVFGAK